MDVTEKQQYCQNVYDNNIIRVMSFLDDMKTIADSYNHMLPVTCFTNFRDALFHFRKIYYASNKNEIMEQGFALKEHLNRSRTDAIVSLLNFFSYGIRMLLNDDTICGMYGKKLRVFLHKMQNINLFKRINGMMIFSYDVDNSVWILDYTQEYEYE